MFYCADSDPAEVYATVRTEDISYGPIIIKDRKKTSKTEGTAALLCLYQDSLLQPETEALCYSGYEDEKIFGILKNETTINDFKTLPIFDATYKLLNLSKKQTKLLQQKKVNNVNMMKMYNKLVA